jgi:uncharacterized Zn-binding protein involved in type VI secretion
MPGFILHQGAMVQCAHGGMVEPTVPSPRVTVMGMPIITAGAPWTVAGCAFPPPPVANGPCVVAQWLPPTAAMRVTSMGMPVLVQSSQAICTPTGTPTIVASTQTRVTAE